MAKLYRSRAEAEQSSSYTTFLFNSKKEAILEFGQSLNRIELMSVMKVKRLVELLDSFNTWRVINNTDYYRQFQDFVQAKLKQNRSRTEAELKQNKSSSYSEVAQLQEATTKWPWMSRRKIGESLSGLTM